MTKKKTNAETNIIPPNGQRPSHASTKHIFTVNIDHKSENRDKMDETLPQMRNQFN